jgi:hypothetical protein
MNCWSDPLGITNVEQGISNVEVALAQRYFLGRRWPLKFLVPEGLLELHILRHSTFLVRYSLSADRQGYSQTLTVPSFQFSVQIVILAPKSVP